MFRELVQQHPELRDALFAALAGVLRRSPSTWRSCTSWTWPAGWPHASPSLRGRRSPAPRAAIELDWPYTQSDLAAMIGGTRQSVNRLLADLIDDGIVRLEHERLIIVDLDATRPDGAPKR